MLMLYFVVLCGAATACLQFKSQPDDAVATAPPTKAVAAQPADFYNWSGYAATNAIYTQATGTIVVPSVRCQASNAETLFWVGLDGFVSSSNRTVEQVGLAALCGSTPGVAPSYQAFWEMYPTNAVQYVPASQFSVAPGDKITMSVAYQNGQFALGLRNFVRGQAFQTNQPCAAGLTCARQSAEWVAERPSLSSGYAPLGDWGQASWTQVDAAGGTDSNWLEPISAFPYQPIAMVNGDGSHQLAAVSGLAAAGGASFSSVWLAAD